MKTLYFLLVTSILFLFVAGCAETQETGPEPIESIVDADHEHATTLLNNNYVSLVEFRLPPGDALPMHEGGPRVVYSLSDYTLQWTEAGTEQEVSWSAGDAHAHEALDHAAANTGDSEAHYLVLTRLDAALPPVEGTPLDSDVSVVAPENAELLFENDLFRVTEVTLPSGASIPEHGGVYRVIYSLTSYTLAYDSEEMGSITSTFEEGDAHWHEPGLHAMQNAGETEARFVVFSVKQ